MASKVTAAIPTERHGGQVAYGDAAGDEHRGDDEGEHDRWSRGRARASRGSRTRRAPRATGSHDAAPVVDLARRAG